MHNIRPGTYIPLLCLLFSVSILVHAENSQEIGEPYFGHDSRRHITLAPDGETFYALDRKGLVSRYQLSPFKKIDSFQLPKVEKPYRVYGASIILISGDGKKLLFYNILSLMLFDLNTREILNKVQFDRAGDGAVMVGDRILTLFNGKHSNTYYGDHNVYTYIEFQVWNSNDLSKMDDVFYFEGRKYPQDRLTIHNKLILMELGDYVVFALFPKLGYPSGTQRQPSLAIFDKETLQPQFIASFQDLRKSDWKSNLRFSHDFSKVYVLNAGPYNARAFPNNRFQTPLSKATLEIDLKTLKRKTLTNNWKDVESTTVDLHLVEGKGSLHFSRADNYSSWWNQLFDSTKREESLFYLLPDGEAVLQNNATKKIKITRNARKYLKMKKASGDIAPMNEVTFNQYISEAN